MSQRTPHPSIPAEALLRQARLQTVLRAMEAVGPSREPACLQDLRAMLTNGSPLEFESIIEAILADELVEEAAEFLRTSRHDALERVRLDAIASHLAPIAAKVRQRRSALWQLDTRRVLIRIRYAKEEAALDFDDGELRVVFLQALRLEGFCLALDLGKRPRPLLSIGLPLPAGAAGLAESMDLVLQREPLDEPATLLTRLNNRLPQGLRVHQWETLPGFASAMGDLAVLSHWRWEVSPEARHSTEEKVATFLAANTWNWARGTSKPEASLDLRRLIPEMRWEGGALCFATRMGAFQAINPLKMLGAILDGDPAVIKGLVRTSVDLKPDPRLSQGGRFEPKLKNMYEDAVLLGGGSNITLVDEDDDEPLHLS